MPATFDRQQVFDDFCDRRMGALSSSGFRTWMTLFRHAHEQDGRVTMTQAELARHARASVATVRRGLAELRALDLVACTDTRNGTREGAMTYALQTPGTEAN